MHRDSLLCCCVCDRLPFRVALCSSIRLWTMSAEPSDPPPGGTPAAVAAATPAATDDPNAIIFNELKNFLMDHLDTQRLQIVALLGKVSALEAAAAQAEAAPVEPLSGVPCGTIGSFVGALAPAGWLELNGAYIFHDEHPQLCDIMGTTFGAIQMHNNRHQHKLPDLRGRTIIGVGQGAGLTDRQRGVPLGMEDVGLTIQHLPKHSHGVHDPGHSHTYEASLGTLDNPHNLNHQRRYDVQRQHQSSRETTGIQIQDTGANTPHPNMQPSMPLLWIVKN